MPPRRSTRNTNKNCSTSDTIDKPSRTENVNGGRVKKLPTQGRKRKSVGQAKKGKSPAQTKKKKVIASKSNPQRPTVSAMPQPKPTVISFTAAPRPKPTVISLDVTFSESDEDTSDIEEVLVPTVVTVPPLVTNPSLEKGSSTTKHSDNEWPPVHMKDGRCIIPSDSDDDLNVMPVPAVQRRKPEHTNTVDEKLSSFDSDSDDDLYGVHHTVKRNKAFRIVANEYKNMEVDTVKNGVEEPSLVAFKPLSAKEEGGEGSLTDCSLYHDDDDDNDDDASSSTSILDLSSKLDLASVAVEASSIVLRGSACRSGRKTNRKTEKAIASLQAFSKRYQEDIIRSASNSSMNDPLLDDDTIILDDFKTSIPVRVRWGTTYLRHTISRSNKFVSLYQEIADKHQVSVSQVVLSFRDSVISPEATPLQIGISIGDIIEGGILQSQASVTASVNSRPEKSADENSINLKVQTSNRRTFHVLQLNKYDHMSVLIDKYAELRGIPKEKLRFKFDGEALDPQETPASLDLEGDECIDVFELT